MSRIGKQPIAIPSGVKVEIKGSHVTITGKRGALERDIRPEIELKLDGDLLVVSPKGNSKRVMAFWGMTRTLLNNMVIGVEKGFQKKLVVEGVGFRANVAASVLTLSVGYSNPVEFQLPDGITADVDKDNTITIDGINNEVVGLTAARIRAIRKPEPYKGKGIRYADEHIVRKVGKSGGSS
ncbi:LSU ribosomal protein L6p (L9e) [hydrothermal vent metagenome]|uniref:LSU ribosomal protein L6p (L9e) n=1 Tax=hydrothermal vent metagenome TaxID=652676 RepID=A0A3B0UVT1_9ZZZZ